MSGAAPRVPTRGTELLRPMKLPPQDWQPTNAP